MLSSLLKRIITKSLKIEKEKMFIIYSSKLQEHQPCYFCSTEANTVSLSKSPSKLLSENLNNSSENNCDYFRKLAVTAQRNLPSAIKDLDNLMASELEKSGKSLHELKPALPTDSKSLTPYVNDSVTLQNLLKLGVNLHEIEQKHPHMCNTIIRLDFEKDVKPVVIFLYHNFVNKHKIGHVITKCPEIFNEDFTDLDNVVKYLLSRKFTQQDVGHIFTKAPILLKFETKDIEKQITFLQKEFKFNNEEIRDICAQVPKFLTFPSKYFHLSRVNLKEICGFTDENIRHIMRVTPKVMFENHINVEKVFDYMHNVIGLSHETILHWPDILRKRLHFIRERHQFLKTIGRDQFDQTKENYVSPKALSTGRDSEFCERVAKVSVAKYNSFLQTL